MINLIIKPLTPDLTPAYLDFFDNKAFSDGNPNGPCYCDIPSMTTEEVYQLTEHCTDLRATIRKNASERVAAGKIHGYLAFDGERPIGWCNAGDMNIFPANKWQFVPDYARQNN